MIIHTKNKVTKDCNKKNVKMIIDSAIIKDGLKANAIWQSI